MSLTFEQVSFNSLVSGKKYKILNDNNSLFTGYYDKIYDGHLEFTRANLLIVGHKFFASIYFKQTDNYFVPISKKLVQEEMEKRSLHMIMRTVLGDPYFEW
jgi:hypothetical protein